MKKMTVKTTRLVLTVLFAVVLILPAVGCEKLVTKAINDQWDMGLQQYNPRLSRIPMVNEWMQDTIGELVDGLVGPGGNMGGK